MLPILEIFGPTLQGEGPVAGRVTGFVRLSGCDFRCSWCDTPDSWKVGPGTEWITPQAAVDRITETGLRLRQGLVTITGGNPLLWDAVPELIDRLHAARCQVSIETQGSIWKPWITMVDYPVISPKPPSSGQTFRWQPLAELIKWAPHAAIKVVVFDDVDLGWASVLRAATLKQQWFLSVGTPTYLEDVVLRQQHEVILERWKWLANKVLEDPVWHSVTVLPQLHKLVDVK